MITNFYFRLQYIPICVDWKPRVFCGKHWLIIKVCSKISWDPSYHPAWATTDVITSRKTTKGNKTCWRLEEDKLWTNLVWCIYFQSAKKYTLVCHLSMCMHCLVIDKDKNQNKSKKSIWSILGTFFKKKSWFEEH